METSSSPQQLQPTDSDTKTPLPPPPQTVVNITPCTINPTCPSPASSTIKNGGSDQENNSPTTDDTSLVVFSGSVDDDQTTDMGYFNTFPSGWRFYPTDYELIVEYLMKKVRNEPLPRNKMVYLEFYRHNPQTLANMYSNFGEGAWYFFTPTNKKYPNGTRPNRIARGGYWKANGRDMPVKGEDGVVVGYKKSFNFIRGKHKDGQKTEWKMHEYRILQGRSKRRVTTDNRLDDCVLCKIYTTGRKSKLRNGPDNPADIDHSINITNDDDDDLTSHDLAAAPAPVDMDCVQDYSQNLFSGLPPNFNPNTHPYYVEQPQYYTYNKVGALNQDVSAFLPKFHQHLSPLLPSFRVEHHNQDMFSDFSQLPSLPPFPDQNVIGGFPPGVFNVSGGFPSVDSGIEANVEDDMVGHTIFNDSFNP